MAQEKEGADGSYRQRAVESHGRRMEPSFNVIFLIFRLRKTRIIHVFSSFGIRLRSRIRLLDLRSYRFSTQYRWFDDLIRWSTWYGLLCGCPASRMGLRTECSRSTSLGTYTYSHASANA